MQPGAEPTCRAFTGKQRIALSLAKGGMSHSEIARRLGIKHRVTVTKLIARGRKAEDDYRRYAIALLG